jgi:hypothetical protein
MSAANLAFSLQSYSVEGPVLRFQAIAITRDYCPKEFLGQLAETAKNKEIRFRHISPDNQVESYLGRILDTKLQDGTMIITGEILGNTPEQQGVQQWIREQQAKGEPLGISMGFIVTKDEKTNQVIRVDAREASITPSPKCGECRITNLLNEKSGEMRVMSTPTPAAQPNGTPTPASNIPAMTSTTSSPITGSTAPPAPIPTVDTMGNPVPQDPRYAEHVAALERTITLLTKENVALQEFIGAFAKVHDATVAEYEKLKTLPIRNEIAGLQRLYGAEYLVEVKKLESTPMPTLTEIRDRLKMAKGPAASGRPPVIPALRSLETQQLDVANMTRDEKAKLADDYYKKYSKRSVG